MIGAPISDSCGPAYSSGSSFGGSPVISGGSPIGEEAPPLDLSPINPTGGTTTSSGGIPPEAPQGFRVPTGTDKAVYQSYKPPGGSPSARREPAALGVTTEPSRPVDPLANLPTLNPPTDLSSSGPAKEAEARKLVTAKVPNSPPTITALTAPVQPIITNDAASNTPGIRTFKVVEPRLAGGSLPTQAGWTWLADQGYKTVLDLRPTAEVQSSDVAAINATGIHYLALPMGSGDVDLAAQLDRFTAEISKEPSRPIFFFDADGSRAAGLWYMYQVSHLKSSPEEARRGAAEIGPVNTTLVNKGISAIPATPTAPQTLNAPEPPSSATPDLEDALSSTGRPA